MTYQAGGSLAANSPVYITREADTILYQSLRQGEFCCIFATRQSGKSSLKNSIISRLESDNYICFTVDMLELGGQEVTEEQWYYGFVDRLKRKFLPQFNLEEWWDSRNYLTYGEKLSQFVEDILLTNILKNIVFFIDELDSLVNLKFAVDNFLIFLRSCYEKRAINRNYERLTFAVFGVISPAELMTNPENNPFNLGHFIDLQGFHLEQIRELARIGRLGDKFQNFNAATREIQKWTGGQPFLTQQVCKILQNKPISTTNEIASIQAIIHQEIITNWETKDISQHLKTIRNQALHLPNEIARLATYREILEGQEINYDAELDYLVELMLSGLVKRHPNNILVVYNQIYREIFNLNWTKKKLASLRVLTVKH
jgi:hypothetical protein